MDSDALDRAVDSMSARDAEALMAKLEKRLQACIVDGNDGAIPCRVTAKIPSHVVFTLLLCPACIAKHRLPESRSDDPS